MWIPKSLIEINGEPFLWHQLRLLRENGIDRVVLCLSYLGELVRDSVGDGRNFGLHIDYSFDGDTLSAPPAPSSAAPLLGESFLSSTAARICRSTDWPSSTLSS